MWENLNDLVARILGFIEYMYDTIECLHMTSGQGHLVHTQYMMIKFPPAIPISISIYIDYI